ncbi:uncharacterized protein LOC125577317 isoform X1 [Brassica napus]|uniref:uncharacterized protein LOC106422108 isoform X1 n=1 Tax=Brassica napus TaxID=3708 RepID=UPI0006AB6B76|nr:uncharacterized protein LOC106422108 isoform X1 [Brassica napus]XP_048594629.1 uncharacterized protein LOC125577317 isoform X1 [Brassica napus]
MSTPRNGFSKHQRAEKVCGQRGPNWILIAGGALLSTLSIRFGYKLKQSPLFKPPHQSNASPGFKANGTSERQRCCCLHSSTTSSCAKNNGYSCFRSVPDALAVNSDGRYLTTRGVDRHVHKFVYCVTGR